MYEAAAANTWSNVRRLTRLFVLPFDRLVHTHTPAVSFHLFDVDKSGKISKKEMTEVLKAMNNTVSYFGDDKMADDKVDKLVSEVSVHIHTNQQQQRDQIHASLPLSPYRCLLYHRFLTSLTSTTMRSSTLQVMATQTHLCSSAADVEPTTLTKILA